MYTSGKCLNWNSKICPIAMYCMGNTVQLIYKVKWVRELYASPSRVAREKLASAVACAFLLALVVSHLAATEPKIHA